MAAEKGKYASVETSYFLMQIYYTYEKDYPRALALAERLHDRYPKNVLFHKYLGRIYVSLSNWQMVQGTYREIVNRVYKGERGYNASAEREATYYLGLCDMNAREYDAALRHFYRCDELSRMIDTKEPSGFMVMANLKIGMIYDALAKRDLAVRQYRKVLDMKEYLNSYKQAEGFLKTPFLQ
jgi:tetratricopeptide (TPR) repeat protein